MITTTATAPEWPPDYILIPRWGRIKLVPATGEDDPDVVSLRTNPETRKYLPSMPADLTLEQWRRRKKDSSKNRETWDINIHFTDEHLTHSPSPETAAITLPSQSSRSFVGVCGVFRIDHVNKSGDVGILIRPDLYRNYIATEALYCNLVLAFEHPQLELYRVSFVTASFNVRMRGWLERFGIALECQLKEAWSDGEGGRLDVVIYTILKPDWPTLKVKMKEELDKRLSKC